MKIWHQIVLDPLLKVPMLIVFYLKGKWKEENLFPIRLDGHTRVYDQF